MSAAKAGDLQPQEQRPDAFLASQKLDEQNYVMDGQEQDGGIESGEVPAAVSGIEGTGSTGSQYMYGNGGGSEYIPPHERMYQVNGNSEANGNTPTTQDDIDVQPARNGGGYVPPHMRQKQQAMQALALGGAAPPPPPPPKSQDTENSGGVKKMHGDSGEGVSKVEKDELYLKSVNKRVAYFEKQGSISKIMDDMRATIRMARTKSSGAQASAIGAMGQAQEQALSQTQNSMQQESAPYATEQPQVTVQTINEGGVILDRDTQGEQDERDEVEAVLQEEEEPEKQEEGGHREIQEAAPEVVQQVCNDVQSLDIQDEPNTEVECAEQAIPPSHIDSQQEEVVISNNDMGPQYAMAITEDVQVVQETGTYEAVPEEVTAPVPQHPYESNEQDLQQTMEVGNKAATVADLPEQLEDSYQTGNSPYEGNNTSATNISLPTTLNGTIPSLPDNIVDDPSPNGVEAVPPPPTYKKDPPLRKQDAEATSQHRPSSNSSSTSLQGAYPSHHAHSNSFTPHNPPSYAPRMYSQSFRSANNSPHMGPMPNHIYQPMRTDITPANTPPMMPMAVAPPHVPRMPYQPGVQALYYPNPYGIPPQAHPQVIHAQVPHALPGGQWASVMQQPMSQGVRVINPMVRPVMPPHPGPYTFQQPPPPYPHRPPVPKHASMQSLETDPMRHAASPRPQSPASVHALYFQHPQQQHQQQQMNPQQQQQQQPHYPTQPTLQPDGRGDGMNHMHNMSNNLAAPPPPPPPPLPSTQHGIARPTPFHNPSVPGPWAQDADSMSEGGDSIRSHERMNSNHRGRGRRGGTPTYRGRGGGRGGRSDISRNPSAPPNVLPYQPMRGGASQSYPSRAASFPNHPNPPHMPPPNVQFSPLARTPREGVPPRDGPFHPMNQMEGPIQFHPMGMNSSPMRPMMPMRPQMLDDQGGSFGGVPPQGGMPHAGIPPHLMGGPGMPPPAMPQGMQMMGQQQLHQQQSFQQYQRNQMQMAPNFNPGQQVHDNAAAVAQQVIGNQDE